MEGQGHHHRQEALDSLTRGNKRSSVKKNRAKPIHTVWSDDTMSTRRIHVIDPRFNNVDLGARPVSTPSMRIPTPTYYGSPERRTDGVQIIWSYHEGASNTDAERQQPTATHDVRISSRISQAFTRSLTVWERLRGKGREHIGWFRSFKAIVTFTWLNVLLIFVPIAWGVQYAPVSHVVMFIFCFLAIIPLSKLLHYGGEQLALYCGKSLGDLIVITLNNTVETTVALVLLSKCELKLLQSTIIGVVLLRLLLIPGAAFLAGGAHVLTQELHPHVVQLNNTLLTIGALTLLLPVVFFVAMDRVALGAGVEHITAVLHDDARGNFLKISRALSLFLLVIYVSARIYLHNPPGEKDGLDQHENAPASFKAAVEKMEKEDPEVNPWACIIMLIITVVLMAVTTEFLVQSVQPMRQRLGIKEEWFGLFLLPLVSYSADGLLSIVYFIRYNLQRYIGAPSLVNMLAQGRSIDLGIQFLIFWMPLLVIFGWFAHKPMSLLFDVFEVATLLGACFLVNYVTADAKTNWAEGMAMVVFYFMICITAWFYPGQPEVHHMLSCSNVQTSLAIHKTTTDSSPLTTQTTTGLIDQPGANGVYVTTRAIELLNDRLEKLISLHGVLPKIGQ